MQDYLPIGKLDPSTLVYTVGAVIASLPSINKDIADISKDLTEEYPEYTRAEIGVVSQHPIDPLKNREEFIIQHALNSPDRNWGILLMQDRILFQTTNYEGFGDFADRFSHVLKVVQEKTGLKYYNGLAFRHIDNIMPKDPNKVLNTAIQQQFLTPDFSQNMNTKFSRHEYAYSTEGRQLIFRLYNFDQGKSYSIPQDVLSNYFGLKGRPHIRVEDKPFVLADFEVNNLMEGKSLDKFEIEIMMQELDTLHKIGSSAYRRVITPEELKARGCENVA